MRPFLSKRNIVLGKHNRVFKCLASEHAANIEANILRALAKQEVPVPKLRHKVGRVLAMEYIDSTPLPDILALPASPSFDAQALANALCEWFAHFYEAVRHSETGEIRGDVNGRNFLITSTGSVWSVDFEEHCFGTMAKDAGRLVAFIKTYDVDDSTRKSALASTVIEAFSTRLAIEKSAILKEMHLELAAIRKRRAK